MSPSAADVIREARRRAGLSQAELARRADVSQPVVSAYETGHREPGMTMLAKLVEASGHRLVVEVSPRGRPAPTRKAPVTRKPAPTRPALPDTPVAQQLLRNRRKVISTAALRGATNVRVFGSVARGEDNEASDIDILVDLDPDVTLLGLGGLQDDLEELLGRKVDVVPAASLKPAVASRALVEAIPL